MLIKSPQSTKDIIIGSHNINALVILFAGLNLGVHFSLWFISLDYLPVGISLSLTNTAPLWLLILTTVILKDRPHVIEWIGVAVGVIGTFLLSQASGAAYSSDELVHGIFAALLSAVALAFYLLLARWGVNRYGLWNYFGKVNLSAAGFILFYLLIVGVPLKIDLHIVYYGLALAIIPGLLGHAFFQYSMSKLPSSIVAAATLGEPLLGTLIAWFFYHQYLSGSQIFGIFLVLAGVATVAVYTASNDSS